MLYRGMSHQAFCSQEAISVRFTSDKNFSALVVLENLDALSTIS